MKILIDECIPKRVKSLLKGFSVFTSHEMGWTSLENGDLMRAAVEKQFDVLLTVDKHLEFQQNIRDFKLTVVVLDVHINKIELISPLIPKLIEKLPTFEKGKVYYL